MRDEREDGIVPSWVNGFRVSTVVVTLKEEECGSLSGLGNKRCRTFHLTYDGGERL